MVINNIASRYYHLQQKPNNHATKTMAQWIFFQTFLNQEIDGELTDNCDLCGFTHRMGTQNGMSLNGHYFYYGNTSSPWTLGVSSQTADGKIDGNGLCFPSSNSSCRLRWKLEYHHVCPVLRCPKSGALVMSFQPLMAQLVYIQGWMVSCNQGSYIYINIV